MFVVLFHRKLGSFGIRVLCRSYLWLDEEVWHDSIEVHGRRESFVLKQGEEGAPAAEICSKVGISQATYFNWKKRSAGVVRSGMRRLRELEDENNRSKKIVADLTLDRAMLQAEGL